MKWYSRQTNRWSYRPGLPFISIEIGSTSKLDSSAHSIRLLLDSLDFFIFLIVSIHLLLNSLLFIFHLFIFYLFINYLIFSPLPTLSLAEYSGWHESTYKYKHWTNRWMVKGWISHVLWAFLLFPLQKYFLQKFLKFFSAAATLHFKWLLHFKEPYCVGEKMSLI